MTEGAEQRPPPSSARLGYCFTQAASLSLLTAISWVARGYQTVFEQLEMKYLPFPTEVLLRVSEGIRSTAGTIGVAVAGVVLIGLALRGVLDPFLKKLIVFNVLWSALMIPFAILSLHVPIRQIQHNLESK